MMSIHDRQGASGDRRLHAFGHAGGRGIVHVFILASLTLIFALSGPAAVHGQFVIDDFNSDQGVFDSGPSGAAVSSSMADASVVGGHRNLQVVRTGPPTGVFEVTGESNQLQAGLFSFDQQSSLASGIGWIIYDGSSDATILHPQGLPGIDLTQGGALDALEFMSISVAGGGLVLTVNLYNDTNGSVSTYSTTFSDGFAGNLVIPYSAFSVPGTAANLGALEVKIDGQFNAAADGSDITFQRISSVPEPTGPALFGMLALALAGASRWGVRQRSKQRESR